MFNISTPRLRFRQWQEADFPYFKKFFSDPQAARFVGGLKNPEEAWRLMATYMGHYQLKGYSYVAVEEKSTGNFIGCVGLWNSEPWPELELGYWFLPASQGKGLASEAALAIKTYAFDVLKVENLVSYIDEANEPSKKLAERIGGKLDKKIQLLEFGEHLVYRYSK